MDIENLCTWLRENSSGAYRKSADAACLIEQLSAENARLQSIIDEANAQEPVGNLIISKYKGSGICYDFSWIKSPETGQVMASYLSDGVYSCYARPIASPNGE